VSDNTKLTKQELAEQLGVSRSSLYYRRKQPAKDEDLRLLIAAEMELNQDATERVWALSISNAAHRACSNAWFTRQGLFTFEATAQRTQL
jgi:DNA-binding XRE family transcriptional regulator